MNNIMKQLDSLSAVADEIVSAFPQFCDDNSVNSDTIKMIAAEFDRISGQRDQIAMCALQGMLAHPTRYKPRKGAPDNWHDAIAQQAYEIADAMVAASRPAPQMDPANTGRAEKIKQYLQDMDDALLERDGPVELTHEQAKLALRDVYLLSSGKDPETSW